jgi:hypothetical protein
MEQEEAGKGSSLSWRSRDTSWWTSAVDLSSTLISKMDQVGGYGEYAQHAAVNTSFR